MIGLQPYETLPLIGGAAVSWGGTRPREWNGPGLTIAAPWLTRIFARFQKYTLVNLVAHDKKWRVKAL